ncbi:MAG: hypothetical protein KBS36_03265 [Bacteroidales bacterium]|nr:hypothetical protein [Candidatus Cryptobacteroides fimicaballi]
MSQSAGSNTRNSIIALLFFASAWCCLFFVCPFHLIYKEQLTLFLCDKAYLTSLLAKPAFAAVIAGDFLTQFFLYRFAAATITVLISLAVWDGIRRLWKRDGLHNAVLCALIPAAACIALSCHTEYPLSMTVGAAIAAWMAYGCSLIGNKTLRAVATVAAALIIYPLAGAHSLLFVVLTALHERKRISAALGILVYGVAIIGIQGYAYNLLWQDAFSYPLIRGYSYKHSLICLIVELAAAGAFAEGFIGKNRIAVSCSAVLVAGGIICLQFDAKKEYDLKVSTLAYYGKWDKVESMGRENRFKSQTAAYYYNLAMARQGRLPDELLNVYQPLFYGLFLPVTMTETYSKVLAGADALIECGDYGQAQHSAMLGMTFMPNQRSSRAVRRLAEIAVYNGDTLAAAKYLGMLDKTLMHRRWARQTKALVENGTATPLNSYRDTIYFINDYRASLTNILDSGNAPAATLDYLLCYDLLIKNLVLFMQDYDRYYLPKYPSIIPPRIYQEALEMMEAGPEYNISPEVKSDNQLFLSGQEYKFPKSYWYYFKYAQPGNEN